ncbi:MAG: exodeoxyribonuclease VII large subunit [Cardiobacteriaceae bacterium]|nr:exodeoxyribonuclease VII large subunit [Cardiobacteriaceae bacterium]
MELRVLTVSQLNQGIRLCLEDVFGDIWLEGEISNLARPSSGHVYFSLKDDEAQIACVLFKQMQAGMGLSLEALVHGLKIRVHGKVSVYTVRGNYQLMIDRLEPVGEGALEWEYQKRFERLSALGLFDPNTKPPLPHYPQRIGIITSLTAAALQDVLSVFKRRNPSLEIVIYPSLVQGAEAAGQLVKQLYVANQRHEVEALLLIRGGGSLEDLWAFNDEALCHAIAESALPIVTGIGHETDTTLADYCATLRASTPTAAAELVCATLESQQTELRYLESALSRAIRAYLERLRDCLPNQQQLTQAIEWQCERHQQYLQQQSALLERCHPVALHQQMSQRLDEWEGRLMALGQRLTVYEHERQRHLSHQLHQAMNRYMKEQEQRWQQWGQHLEHLSPLAVLRRGFALAQDSQGRVIRNGRDCVVGDRIVVQLHEGTLDCVVETVHHC